MILEVKYNGKIPTVFIAMVLEDWILVLILIWNHRDNKQNIKYALIYGIISTIILIILYKLGKFDFEDIFERLEKVTIQNLTDLIMKPCNLVRLSIWKFLSS